MSQLPQYAFTACAGSAFPFTEIWHLPSSAFVSIQGRRYPICKATAIIYLLPVSQSYSVEPVLMVAVVQVTKESPSFF
jgi:hypothetical protein